VEGLVEIAADPNGAAAPVQDVVDHIGQGCLPAARLAGGEHHHRTPLADRAIDRRWKNARGQDPLVLPVGQNDWHHALLTHR
jgi:hypothetical protein